MRNAERIGLTATAAVLALWLIFGFWPLAIGSRVALSLLVMTVSGGLLWQQRRIARRSTQIQKEMTDDELPPENYTGAVVLVCGDSAPLFAPAIRHRESRQGWYLQVERAEQLPLLIRYLSDTRQALLPRLFLLLAIVPEQHTDSEAFASQLRKWQRTIAQCRSVTGHLPPRGIISWVSPPAPAFATEPLWLSATRQHPDLMICHSGAGFLPLTQWCHEDTTGSARLCQRLWLESVLDWQHETLYPIVTARSRNLPALEPCLHGICLTPVNGVSGNLWQQHITACTTLPPPVTTTPELLPLPDGLLAALPRIRGISPRMRFWRAAGGLVGLFLLLAMLASWFNNQRLIRQVSDHLALYHTLSGDPAAPKLRAQQRLRADAALLDGWQRRGEPLRYRLGLYQGGRLMLPLETAISDWAPSPPVIKQIITGPQTIRLDSMSLFDSGQSALKTDSTKILINSLVGIKAKPGWLIVVSGHTDNTGRAALNQALSLKRAEAVRNWMRDTGDVPESCFAVQGYGADRPIATNDTAAGRALNRRVEISLVPQADACQLPGITPASPETGDVTTQQ